jgi:hypothetical protein
MKPTEKAEFSFMTASRWFASIVAEKNTGVQLSLLAQGLGVLTTGLIHMSTGLRATYMLLEEVKAAADRQRAQPQSIAAGSQRAS